MPLREASISSRISERGAPRTRSSCSRTLPDRLGFRNIGVYPEDGINSKSIPGLSRKLCEYFVAPATETHDLVLHLRARTNRAKFASRRGRGESAI